MAESGADLYSVEQVAERLNLHVRTIRKYVREGRLKATRIGKQYRVARRDLAALTGQPADSPVEEPAAVRRSDASSIVIVEPITPEEVSRLTAALIAAANGPPEEQPLRVDSVFDPGIRRLKVVITGSVVSTAMLLRFVAAYLDAHR